MVNTYACKQQLQLLKTSEQKQQQMEYLLQVLIHHLMITYSKQNHLEFFNKSKKVSCHHVRKSRTPKLIARNTYETSSITTKKGERIKGAPGGRRKLKKNVSHEFEIR